MDAYGSDLAFIHEAGFNRLAINAASAILADLPPAAQALPVTDLGCGGGTFAELVTKAGYQVVGFDLSPHMVELARARVPEASFHVASFVDAPIPRSSAVTVIGEVLNYTFDGRSDLQAMKALMQRIFLSLAPSGVLLFDVATPARGETAPKQAFTNNDSWTVLVENTVVDQILTRDITTYRREGDLFRRTHEVHRLNLFDSEVVVDILKSVGFDVSVRKDYAGHRAFPGLSIFHARKPHDADQSKPGG